MASLRDQLGGLVYSTEHGKTCPTCREALEACYCDDVSEQQRLAELDGIVRIRRETSGRKGKGVTTVSGIPLSGDELKTLAKTLKKRCGTGGAIKDGIIEIQGDHRDVLRQELSTLGYQVKLAGG
ncbi:MULTISPECIES: translation initiation factor Sui1 [unclassified Halomonas]|uniref:translation initiation factor Sui1 n=1 Tax=Halomonadaceae TaxID=28256 RepID=UPI00022D3224|nr:MULTISPECIES: translation initiation factor Sui1 [unclassified Halomonas]EHA13956.1 translation initiation factor 1 (eIF-1/SUI1) [Halomonas sp. HAL1]PKG52985.1 translation initiation factor [Halomonas sp. MES3-P3E]WKV93104.1 translation initiation factor Sui1 [Halomonas sp. HAL1]|tara:strand:+ start:1147 stop:1521 length:375 start_codon:yes stop_codon:yes gene_type:complete